MGMITESQIVNETRQTNALLNQLIQEVRHTNALIEWLGNTLGGAANPATGGTGELPQHLPG